MNQDSILRALEMRYAAKKFDPSKRIPDPDWKILESSLVLSPSSYGLEPWKFHVVENAPLREKLRAASWNQTQVTDASHYVVLTAKERILREDVEALLQRTSSTRGVPLDALAGYRSIIEGDVLNGPKADFMEAWNQRQVYIAFGFIMLTAALLGIDTCPMEGIEPPKYDEILGIKGSGYKSVAGLALGYRHAEDKYASAKKVRKSATEVLIHHR
jgi:nitroreductase